MTESLQGGPSPGFNEAGAFLPRKTDIVRYLDVPPGNASMRPGHFYPGKQRAQDIVGAKAGPASMRPGHFYPGKPEQLDEGDIQVPVLQ